jgi:hypothetical protein
MRARVGIGGARSLDHLEHRPLPSTTSDAPHHARGFPVLRGRAGGTQPRRSAADRGRPRVTSVDGQRLLICQEAGAWQVAPSCAAYCVATSGLDAHRLSQARRPHDSRIRHGRSRRRRRGRACRSWGRCRAGRCRPQRRSHAGRRCRRCRKTPDRSADRRSGHGNGSGRAGNAPRKDLPHRRCSTSRRVRGRHRHCRGRRCSGRPRRGSRPRAGR